MYCKNRYFKEKLTLKGIIGSLGIMIGCVLAIIFGSHDQGSIDNFGELASKAKQLSFMLYASIDTSLIIIFSIISFRMHSHSIAKDSSINNDINSDMNNNENRINIGSNFEKEKFRHGLRAVLMCFATAGVTAWVQILGKICADLLFDTFDGNNQFDSIGTYLIILITILLIMLELWMISEIMRIFDAVLAIPLFNSFQILSSLFLSASYFNDFVDYTLIQGILFTLSLILIIIGITLVTIGQNSESMKHHESDQIKYISNINNSNIDNINNKNRLRNMSMATLADSDDFQIKVDFADELNDSNDLNIVERSKNKIKSIKKSVRNAAITNNSIKKV